MLFNMEYVLTLASVSVEKVRKFDWSTLVPRFKISKYPKHHAAAGIELTWRMGPGIAVGLGLYDLWFGWPRKESNLHTSECNHER